MFKVNNRLLSFLKILFIFLLSVLAAVFVVFFALACTEYKPEPCENLISNSKSDLKNQKEISKNEDFSILTWNIGYCSLDENADFFMDGGKQVNTSSKKSVNQNIDSIQSVILEENPDIIFLQEIDFNSWRSHSINQVESFTSCFSNFDSYFAPNFKVLFVPFPIPPIGKVYSGIQTLSKYKVAEASRISLPCPFKIPVRYGNLKRCVLENRLKVAESEKELVIINVHLEAYDSGEGKIEQTKVLKKLMKDEYSKGNYVIVGGDFNQTFSNIVLSEYPHVSDKLWRAGLINVADFSSDFDFLMDNSAPTCRSLDKSYADTANGVSPKKDFQFYMIDGFIVSNNVNIKEIQTLDKNFKNSDHNPVKLTVSLD